MRHHYALYLLTLLLVIPTTAVGLTVTTLADENDGLGVGTGTSLREAIGAAIEGETINFDATLFVGGPGTMTLSQPLGDLIVEKSLTITGPGAATLTLSGGGARRIFQVIADVDFAIAGMTLANGLGKGGDGAPGAGGGGGGMGAGGAIYLYDGDVTATGVVFEGNTALGGVGGNSDGVITTGGGGGAVGNGIDANGSAGVLQNGGAGGPAATGAGGTGGVSPFPNEGVDGGPGGGGGGGANSDFGFGSGGDGGFGGGGGGTGRSGTSQTFAQLAGNGGFGGGGGGAGRRNLDFPAPAATSGGFGGTGGTATNTTANTGTGSGGGGGAALGGAVFVNDTASFTATGCDFTGNTATGGAPGTSVGDATMATAGIGKGGAIFVRAGGVATLADAVFSGNSASDAGSVAADNDHRYGAMALAFTGIVVDDAGDEGDALPGDGAIVTPSGTITLRSALEELAALGLGAEITFDPALYAGGPFQIDVLAADLIIETEITITGPGAELLTLSGENTRRLFQVIAGGLDIAGLTLANGYGKGGDGGDGSGGGGGGLGGGGAIYVHEGEVTATNVIFLENHAQGGDGGDGLFEIGTGGGGGGIGDGVVADGQTGTSAGGAGGPSLFSPGGTGGVSPFPNPGNPGGRGAGGGGGAISQFGFGSGGAGGFGGGGGGSGDAASGSTAPSNGGAGGFGGGGGGAGWHSVNFPGAGGAGGTFAGSGGATPSVQSDNGGGGGGAGLGGAVFVDESATFTATGCTFSGNSATGGLPGANRGGGALPGAGAGKGGAIFVRTGGTVTLTNPLFDTNDAADAGSTQDDNDSIHGTVTFTIITPFIVDTLEDTADATPGDLAAEDSNGNTSLRAALQETDALNIAAEIQFDPALFSGGSESISLLLGVLGVNNGAKTITGPGADLLTIHGADASRIFEAIDPLTLTGVRLTRGLGGIEAFAPVTVENVVFEDCHAGLANGGAIMAVDVPVLARRSTFAGCTGNNGGGIALLGVSNAALYARECVFTGNASEVSGGAIFVDSAELALVNCTLSGNETAGPGGAFQAGLKVGSAMAHCTITGNRADSDGDDAGIASAVSISGGDAPLYNSIVAGNFSGPQGSPFEFLQPDVSATAIPDGGTNIIGNSAGITNGLDASSRDFAALGISDLSELLSPLAGNGGATQTHALPLGSPAINTGDDDLAVDPNSSLPLTTDQRGTGFPRIEGSAVDIGAFELTADSVAPTVTIKQAAGQADPVNSLPILFEIIFSEPVLTFDDVSIVTAGASGPVLSLTRTGLATFELAVNALGDEGDLTVSILAGAAEDTFGNLSTASTSSDDTVTYDTASPTLQWAGPGVDPVGGSPVPFTATFDEPVYGLSSADLVVTNGVGSIVAGADGDAVFEINVVPTGDGLLTLTMPAGVCEDAAGNANVGPVQISRTFDSTGPVPVVTSTSPTPTNAAPIAITVTFDEPVLDVIAGGLALTNASVVRTGGDPGGTEFTYDLTPLSEGLFSVSVLPGAATDPVGNSSAASNTLNFTYDITAPTAVVATTVVSPTDSAIPFTVVFNEAVVGFGAVDLAVTNGTVANFTGTSTSYAFDIFPGNDGVVDVDLPAGVAQDAAGNANLAASLATDLVYDTVAPSVISVTRTGGSLSNAATVDFAVEFSEAVSGVDAADFTVDVTSILTGTSVAGVVGVGAEYLVSVNTGSGEGLLSIDVTANGTVVDAADRPLAQAFTSGEAYQVDRVAPTATLFSSAPDPVTTANIPVTVTFSESVSGLDLADIAVTNGTPQDLAGSGAVYTFTVVAAASGIVSVTVDDGAVQDPAGNGSMASSTLTREYIDLGECDTPFHTADQNHDNKIALSELLRAIQFYNSETYHCQAGTEDGYAPGLGDIGTCCPHDSDYGLQNWSISLSELLRAIQFYNTGEYHYCPSNATEDGYCPGAAP